MYLNYYGLKEPPFSITPDPRFVFLSERHRDALAHLLYGIGQGGGGGFVQLTGEVGTGKTTLCRLLLEQLPEDTRVALVLNPKLSPLELLETICEELKIDLTGRRGSLKGLVDGLNAYLLDAYAQGLRVVLIIDEAQNLSIEALEQVRLLTNLETPTQKLLQIILLGQPELRELLSREDLRQLSQRITARYHLTPLSTDETDSYVRHRLQVAGCNRMPFTRLALRRMHEHAEGVPRLLNVIADRALMAGYAKNLTQIGEREVDAAAAEALASSKRRPKIRISAIAAAIVAAMALSIALWPERQTAAPEPISEESEDSVDRGRSDVDLMAVMAEAHDTYPSAWAHLLGLWMIRSEQLDATTAARCASQPVPGIYCLRGGGSLTKLETLRRPVILRLSNDGVDTWAVLTGISNQHARLLISGQNYTVGRHELERSWLGEFYALWKAPVFLSSNLKRGDVGPEVEWLHGKLKARGLLRELPPQPAYYDESTVAAVRSLQASHGLVPDGIVGPETLFALTSDESGPRLARRPPPSVTAAEGG
ncbi:ExeA family protein [Pseudomarimonas arenosa]|uniref:AAA family ATPase n=1 Tax=Pseudomarimonas arenosa TaxID=2774145 RepID=A0AAW3ZF82_9GAMM|nr:ExeA family protein [Pseudomarimonas arenosa]MBD8524299.1 AAA family ATPase [Pseudomarimonas arenosa]